jgi:hypothetical protein
LETFTPVARLEAIRILLAFAASKGFKLYQLDVKSAFLNGVIHEDVFVKQLSYPVFIPKPSTRHMYDLVLTFLMQLRKRTELSM